MARGNVEIVRRGYAALAREDADAFLAVVDEDAVYHSLLAPLLEKPAYRGHAEVQRLLFEEIPAVLGEFTAEIVGCREVVPDVVVVEARMRGVAGHTVQPLQVEQTAWQVLRMRAGKVVEMRSFRTEAEALAAATPPDLRAGSS